MFKKVLTGLGLAALLALAACARPQAPAAPAPSPPVYHPAPPAQVDPHQDYEQSYEENTGPEYPAGHLPIRTPEEYLAANENADIIIGEEGAFYAQAASVPWIGRQLDLADASPLATVQRSGVSERFEKWDATALPEGTKLLRHNQEPDVLVVEVEGEWVPYLRFVGGSEQADSQQT